MSRRARARPGSPKVKTYHLKSKCPTTGKLKFATELDALLEHQKNPLRVRAYHCQFCDFYHVTSQPCRYCNDWHGSAGCAPAGD